MMIQGYSPLPQPNNLFTLEEYKTFLTTYRQMEQAQWDRQRPDPERAHLREQVRTLKEMYFARLPIYLLARCPLCGGGVSEAIDTFSLNGIGWKQPHGLGWCGGGWDQAAGSYRYSFKAECKHAQLITHSVNLNGLQPDDVYRSYPLGPEKPFVLRSFGQFKVVIHALPIGRYDDSALIPRYTVYFVTYFTDQQGALETSIGPRDVSDGGELFAYHEADYDLVRRVEKGQLYWLDTQGQGLSLKNKPVEAFPYTNIQGIEGATWLKDGKLEPWRPGETRATAKAAQEAKHPVGFFQGFIRRALGRGSGTNSEEE